TVVEIRGAVRPAVFVFVGQEVLHEGSCLPMLGIRPLQTPGECDGKRTNKERIFPVGLLGAAPSRIAAQIRVRSADYDAATIKDWILVVVPRFVAFQRSDLL